MNEPCFSLENKDHVIGDIQAIRENGFVIEDGTNVTLQSNISPSKKSIYRQYYTFSTRTFKIDYIFIGYHFEKVDDIQFENISVEFSNISNWTGLNKHDLTGRTSISPNESKDGFLIEHHNGEKLDIDIDDICKIQFFSFPSISIEFGDKVKVNHKFFVSFSSHGNKSLSKYIELKSKLQDFLNFVTTYGIVVLSIIGQISVNYGDHIVQERVRIMYKTWISSKMDKVGVISPNLPIYDTDRIIEIIKRWFTLSDKIPAVYDLYFGVMYNPELYLTNRFLMLAEALEIYCEVISGNDISVEQKTERISNITNKLKSSELDQNDIDWIVRVLGERKNLSFKEKMSLVYERYSELLIELSAVIGNKESFSNLVTKYRNRLTHGNVNYDSLKSDELFWKYKDIQLILQLCILSELGYSNNELKSLYLLDKK